jgi:hypothetical protein
MGKLNVYLCIVFVLCAMCKKQIDNNDTIDFSLLNGGDYILKVDRVSNAPNVQFPRDSLYESNYTVINEDIRHEVTFTEDGKMISIKPGPVMGEKTKDGEISKYYELVDGLFAGGRFIIWINNEKFEAEYTIYGSGLPIIKSERGKLELIAK